MNLMRGINLKKLAVKMKGASGAESKAVCTEAGMFALRERRVHVTQDDFEMAVAKVLKKDSEKVRESGCRCVVGVGVGVGVGVVVWCVWVWVWV